jgi:hypothetical protein
VTGASLEGRSHCPPTSTNTSSLYHLRLAKKKMRDMSLQVFAIFGQKNELRQKYWV